MKELLKLILSGAALCTCLTTLAYQVGYSSGQEDATQQALKTNPPSEALEMACLGLWVGEQNKKWSNR
jgi:hypothetical protein